MRTIYLVIFILCIGMGHYNEALSQNVNSPTRPTSKVFDVLRSSFCSRNPKIGHIEITDIRPLYETPLPSETVPNSFLVLARGVRPDFRFEGTWEDELFGIFILDDSLFTVLHTVKIIPSPRWCDYAVRIVSLSYDTLTVHGEGTSYGDAPIDDKISIRPY